MSNLLAQMLLLGVAIGWFCGFVTKHALRAVCTRELSRTLSASRSPMPRLTACANLATADNNRATETCIIFGMSCNAARVEPARCCRMIKMPHARSGGTRLPRSDVNVARCTADFVFWVSELLVGSSAVLAVVVMGLYMNWYKSAISPKVLVFLHEFYGMVRAPLAGSDAIPQHLATPTRASVFARAPTAPEAALLPLSPLFPLCTDSCPILCRCRDRSRT